MTEQHPSFIAVCASGAYFECGSAPDAATPTGVVVVGM